MIGTTVMGHVVDKQLGEGGMGSVWRAVSNQGHCIAVKVMHPHMLKNSALAERFLREADNARGIKNSHVAKVMSVERLTDGRTAIVLQYVDGVPLSDYMRNRLPLAVADADPGALSALGIMIQLADGIRAAHNAGVVHRDIKPDNIMITDDPIAGWVVMLDFGISKRLLAGAQLTGDHMMMGTPSYMAPEQARDAASVTGAADIFSAAVICVELITGRRPYADPRGLEDSPESIITRYAEIRAGARAEPRLTDLARRANGEPLDIPAVWLEQLQRAISVHAEQRPQTAREFIEPMCRSIPRGVELAQFYAKDLLGTFGPDDATRRERLPGATVSVAHSVKPAPADSGTAAGAAGQFATPQPRPRRRGWIVPVAAIGTTAAAGLTIFALTRGGTTSHAASAPRPSAADAAPPADATPPDAAPSTAAALLVDAGAGVVDAAAPSPDAMADAASPDAGSRRHRPGQRPAATGSGSGSTSGRADWDID